jgi:multiple sugar transport system substrate-binding protein
MEHDMTTASTRGRRASVLTRRGLLVATGVFLAAVGAACQLSRPAPAPQRTPDPGSLLKNAHLRASTWLSGGHDAVVTSFFREFEERYPGVKIDHETGQTDERLQAQFAAATPPDLFFVGSQATSLIAGKVVAALDGYIRRDRTDISDFFDRAVQQFRLGGLTYGLPYDFNSSVISYNAELFRRAGLPLPPSDWKAPGWTFQDFLDAAKRLTQRTGAELQVWGYGVGPRQWAGWMAANGGWYLNAERNQLGMAEPATVEALQFAQDLIHLYRVSPALEQSAGWRCTRPPRQTSCGIARCPSNGTWRCIRSGGGRAPLPVAAQPGRWHSPACSATPPGSSASSSPAATCRCATCCAG